MVKWVLDSDGLQTPRNSAPAPRLSGPPSPRGARSPKAFWSLRGLRAPSPRTFPTPFPLCVALLRLRVPAGTVRYRVWGAVGPQFPPCRPQVAGLGNPGLPGTRHSVGMAVLGQLARRLGVAERWARDRRCAADLARAALGDAQLVLLRPRRLMNANGRSVARAAELLGLTAEEVYLVHDDLDKPLGKLALKLGGSARGHNGVRSCISCLNSNAMPRLRVGIGRPTHPNAVQAHVLGRFSPSEQELLPPVLERATDLLLDHIRERSQGPWSGT